MTLNAIAQIFLHKWFLDYFLVLCRVGGAMLLLPALGETSFPNLVKVGLAMAVTLLILPIVSSLLPPVTGNPVAFGLMCAAEITVGLWFGFLARTALLAFGMAGNIIALLLGLSSVLVTDSLASGESTALGNLFVLASVAMVFATHLYIFPLAGLVSSYHLIPAGHWLSAAGSAAMALKAVSASFALAVQISAPFILASTVLQIVLGFAARLMPNIQIYFVILPGQIFGGFILLSLLASVMAGAFIAQLSHTFFFLSPAG